MKETLRPDEEARIARKIEEALRPLDEDPPASLRPDAIVAKLKHAAQDDAYLRQEAPAPPPPHRRKRWIAVAASLAACIVLGVFCAATGLPFRLSRLDKAADEPPVSLTMENMDEVACSTGTTSDTLEDAPVEDTPESAPTEGSLVFTDGTAAEKGEPVGATTTKKAAMETSTQPESGGAPQATRGSTKATKATKATTKASTKNTTAASAGGGAQDGPALLTEEQVAALVGEGALVADVRPAAAYAAGHIAGAVNLPAADAGTADLSAVAGRSLVLFGSEENCRLAASTLEGRGCAVAGYLTGWTGATVQ